MTFPSRLRPTELRCAVSLPPSAWSSRRLVSTRRRGKRHPFVSVLMVACSAVLTGARSLAAIGQWASSAPQDTLARFGARTTTVFNVRTASSAATIRRVLNAACPGGLADLLGHDPAGAETLAVDGKSARGHRCRSSRQKAPSKVHTGHGPDNMATLRSFAINTLRAAGHTNIAAGLREMSYDSFRRPLDLIGLA
ncbi:transposase family protein [Streptomyces sp. NPDC005133]